MQAVAKLVGNLGQKRRPSDTGQHVQQYLEAHARKLAHAAVQHLAAQHEKAAHRVRHRLLQDQSAHARGQQTHGLARLVPVARAATFGVTRSNHHLGTRVNSLQHLRQHSLIVLQICIHHSNDWGSRSHHALNAGRGQAPAANALQATHARIGARHFAHQRSRGVGRVVIYKYGLPACFPQRLLQAPQQLGNIAGLIESGNNNRQTQR